MSPGLEPRGLREELQKDEKTQKHAASSKLQMDYF